jgi:hypothetical protein
MHAALLSSAFDSAFVSAMEVQAMCLSATVTQTSAHICR